MGNLTLMTYNVFSGRTLDGRYDLGGKTETIRAVSPDILGLNEVHLNTNHSGHTSQTELYADALGYKHSFFARAIDHDGGEYGIALLSRFPFISCRTVPVPDEPPEETETSFEPRVHIDAVLDADGKKIRVLASHYGLSHSERVRAVSETIRLSKTPIPAVFMGDLNAEPDDPVLKPLFEYFRDTAEGLGRTETLTFRSDAPDRRIDYIFVTRDFKVLRMVVPAVSESDHRPVVARVFI
ncbi:MAG: endonuclease/exonuclease/phosphatase family protein [Eubacteriales bacterium]